jgi:hypothetical protein
MNNRYIELICLFLLSAVSVVYGQNGTQKDINGNEVINSKGVKINYPQSILQTSKATSVFREKSFVSSSNQSAGTKTNITANVDNLYSIMGSSIGRNSMHSVDIDNDGFLEIVCSAANNTFGTGNFWYIMRYSSETNSWEKIWTSFIGSKSINTIEVADYDGDGIKEILLGYSDGTIDIYNGKTRELKKSLMVSSDGITSIVFADADNDSNNELVIATSAKTYILDPFSYITKYTLPKGGNYVRVGKLDDSGKNEIVLSSGFVYKLTGSTLSLVWNFIASGDGYVELSDIDKDGKQEIVFAQQWYYIYVYDVDTQTTKYSIKTNLDINSLLLTDVNNDGVDEIIYGDGQWGSINCYNSVTQAKLWSVTNPEHGVCAINYADVNGDGSKELIWSAGWTSTGSDYLYVYNVAQNNLIWRSEDIEGPFSAIATGDVDGDGKDEIVAVSYKSESSYDSGILFIFDASNNKLKWKCPSTFFPFIWQGLYTVAIADVDNDGINDIVVAGDNLYDGAIWIIDGKTHAIKSNHIFTKEGLGYFHSLKVDDIDNDGQKEIIVGGNSTLSVINPSTWAVKWSVNVNSTYDCGSINVADVNGDGQKEIVAGRGVIQLINVADHSCWTSTETNYTNVDLFDYNNDNVRDIVASTSTGHIVVIDGKTKSKLLNVAPETSSINSVRAMKIGNAVTFVYSANNKMNFYQSEANCSVSQELGTSFGMNESLQLYHASQNATDLLMGSSISILRSHLKLMSVSADTLRIAADKNSNGTFGITFPESWNISSTQNWLKLSSVSGTGNQTITVTADENTFVSTRTATLTVASPSSVAQTITVIQSGAKPYLSVSDSELSVEKNASSAIIFDISSNLAWTISSNQSWIIPSSSSGSGSSPITLTTLANPTIQSRTASITITAPGFGTKTITVTQAAGDPALTTSTSYVSVKDIASDNSTFFIYANIDWKITCDQDWVTLNYYSGTGNKTIGITVSQNPSTTFRKAILTISAGGVSVITIQIVQDGQTAILAVAPSTVSVGATDRDLKQIAIQSNIGWQVAVDQPWLKLNNSSGSGNSTLSFLVNENHTTKVRTAVITFTGLNVSAQTVTVTQSAGIAMLSLSTNSLTIGSQNSSVDFEITSNTDWVISSNQSWIVPNLTSGSNNSKITISTAKNSTLEARAGSLLVTGIGVTPQIITILQDDTEVSYSGMYPSIVREQFFVKSSGSGSVQIYKQDGNMLTVKEINSSLMTISVAGFTKGIYFIRINDANGTKTAKFIKE